MAAAILNECVGFIRFTGATAAVLQVSGCITAVVRNGAGDYQIATEAIAAADFAMQFWAEGAADAFPRSIVHTSDTSKRVMFVDDANALADPTTVCIKFFRTGYGR